MRIRASICIAALGCLLASTPATAHTIDVRHAAAAVSAQAQTLGEVDQVRCWRPVMAMRVRARHRALCAAWWIHTPTATCMGLYEVRMARHPNRRLLVIQTFQPWCASASAPTSAEGRAELRRPTPSITAGFAALATAATFAVPSGALAAGGWSSYGPDLANSRSQPRPAGVGAASAARLVERWAIRQTGAVDGTTYSVTGSPAVAGDTAYYTDWTGRLTAVELRTGRVRWSTKVSASMGSMAAVNSSPSVAGGTVYVSALEGRVVAVSARTGEIRWSTVLDSHVLTTMYASP